PSRDRLGRVRIEQNPGHVGRRGVARPDHLDWRVDCRRQRRDVLHQQARLTTNQVDGRVAWVAVVGRRRQLELKLTVLSEYLARVAPELIDDLCALCDRWNARRNQL